MAQILAKTPGLQGGVFDLEHGVAGARQTMSERCQLQERCTVFAGSFFDTIPKGADALMMSFILHDWSDSECERILKNCADALPQGGTLLAIDHVIGDESSSPVGELIDLGMLVLTPGRERSRDDFRKLLAIAGFEIIKIIPTESRVCIVEAKSSPSRTVARDSPAVSLELVFGA